MRALAWIARKIDLLLTTMLSQLAAVIGGGLGLFALFVAIHWITGGSFTQAVLSAPATPVAAFISAFLGALLAITGKDRP